MSSLSNSASTSGPPFSTAPAPAQHQSQSQSQPQPQFQRPPRISSASASAPAPTGHRHRHRLHASISSENLRTRVSASATATAPGIDIDIGRAVSAAGSAASTSRLPDRERRERRKSTLTGPDRKRRLVYPYSFQVEEGGGSAGGAQTSYARPASGSGLFGRRPSSMSMSSRGEGEAGMDSRPSLNTGGAAATGSTSHTDRGVATSTSTTAPGTSYETAIDLSSSPSEPPPPPPPHRRSRDHRQSSWSHGDNQFVEYNRPLWQPDTEVTECPICRTTFSFWYRKHHCRKCGRVVCAACSPHRITIPRQYIVHPPNTERSGPSAIAQRATQIVNPEGDGPGQSPVAMNPALGGGEEVRLCNPCVPDPNPEPPFGFSPVRPEVGSGASWTRHRSYHSVSTPRQHPYSAIPDTFTSRPSRRTVGSSDYPGLAGFGGAYAPSLSGRPLSYGSSSRIPPNLSRHPFPFSRAAPDASLPESSSSRPHASHRSSRHINESDLCPICDSELPPLGANGNEDAREEHIRECISNHGRPASGSPVSQSPLPVRMLAFTATEKDCLGQDGAEQECTICMEEYEVGQSLVRLECLCKFHKRCIVEWFERRKECPVHKTS